MDLPALDRLGYALNLINLTPFDIGAVRTTCVIVVPLLTVIRKVDNRVLYQRRLLQIDFDNVRDVVTGRHRLLL